MGRRRAGRRWVIEDSINIVVVSVVRGGGNSRYCNKDFEEMRENFGGASMEKTEA